MMTKIVVPFSNHVRRLALNLGAITGAFAFLFLLTISTQANLVHQWTFEDGTPNDYIGGANGVLNGTATITNGRLYLSGSSPSNNMIATLGAPLGTNKTLVVWFTLSDLTSTAGSPLSVALNADGSVPDDQNTFDAIVYGERTPGQWENGSEFWNRTPLADNGGAIETLTEPNQIMMAITYDGTANQIEIYRNHVLYATVNPANPLIAFPADGKVLIGPRIFGSGSLQGYFNGYIDEARIYDTALSEGEIATMLSARDVAAIAQQPALVHQWTFKDGTANDYIGGANGVLNGTATITNGQLYLSGSSPNNNMIATLGAPLGTNKTLVVWFTLSDLTSTAGSPLSVGVLSPSQSDSGNPFDAIVYGERTPGQWENGSEFWNRTPLADNGGAIETLTEPNQIMMAITYDGTANQIEIYRNGTLYATVNPFNPLIAFSADSEVLIGPRLFGQGYFNGYIDEARIYSVALTADQIANLTPVPNSTTLPNLTFNLNAGVLTLAWPESYLGWYVQSNSVSLSDPNEWFDIPESATVTNLTIPVNPGQSQVFYRMRQP